MKPETSNPDNHHYIPYLEAQSDFNAISIRSIADIPDLLNDGDDRELEWFVEGIIPKRSYCLISGAYGAGKSWSAYALYGAAAMGGTWFGRPVAPMPVLYLDRENSKYTLKSRVRIIAGEPGILKPWGEWLEVPDADDARLLEFANQGCVIIFDSMVRFHLPRKGENDSSDMAEFSARMKALRNAGATVIVLHHLDKAGKGPRGSSEITAGPDVSLILSRKGNLWRLRCDKIRDAEQFSPLDYSFNIETGRFEANDYEKSRSRILGVLRNSPEGESVRHIAKETGITRQKVGSILHNETGRLWVKGKGEKWLDLKSSFGPSCSVDSEKVAQSPK